MLIHKPDAAFFPILSEIVDATKGPQGYVFTFPQVHQTLVNMGLVEVNAAIVDGDKLATRATADGIKHITLARWEASKETLAAAKETEMLLRKEVVTLFSNPDKEKGTENVKLDDGCTLKMVKKLNYSVLKKDADGNPLEDWVSTVEDALDAIAEIGPQYGLVADRLIKWDADLSVSEYNKLSELGEDGAKIKAIIDSVIKVDEGTPTVEIVEPKAKK